MNPGPQVTFTADYFKPIPGEEEHTNPGGMVKPWPTGWLIGFVSVGYPWRESSRRILGG